MDERKSDDKRTSTIKGILNQGLGLEGKSKVDSV